MGKKLRKKNQILIFTPNINDSIGLLFGQE